MRNYSYSYIPIILKLGPELQRLPRVIEDLN